jgi:aldehyde dehydrogenase (NAD+)
MTFYMAGEGRRLFGQTTTSELPNKFCMTVRSSLGVCGLITPWNFPMAIPSWKVMPALICGNTVVLKPATDTPLSAYNLVLVLEEAGLPHGVVNLVTGTGGDVGAYLIRHDDVRAVSFTGSTEIGRQVSEACASNFKHCCLEMGGKNVIMVLEDANLDLAVEGAFWGGFGTTGQRCTAASRVVVQKDVYKDFVDRFVARARVLKVGNGLDPMVQMGPLINEAQRQTVEFYVEVGKNEGAKLLCGGQRLTGNDFDRGWFYAPTIFGECDSQMRIAQEEIFGPVVSIIPCDSLDQALEIGNGVAYGLSSSLYTRNVNNAFTAMREMETGIFYVNAPTIGAETHLPFGGTKQTGNGHREAATATLDFYSQWKSVYVDYSDKLQRAQIDS